MLSIKEWINDNRQNIYLLFGVLLVGVLAFESGFLRGKLVQVEPMIISIPAIAEAQDNKAAETIKENQPTSADSDSKISQTTDKQKIENCPFVGSRNSNKYHLVTCAVAKRIKPENKICFASKEEAEKRGYVPSCMK